MVSVIMLSIVRKPSMLIVIMLNVNILTSIIELSVIMLSVTSKPSILNVMLNVKIMLCVIVLCDESKPSMLSNYAE